MKKSYSIFAIFCLVAAVPGVQASDKSNSHTASPISIGLLGNGDGFRPTKPKVVAAPRDKGATATVTGNGAGLRPNPKATGN